jgi:GT2 family glycosyltransferase
MSEEPPAVTVVVLAYGEEPWLARCVDSLLAATAVRTTVVLVDNGCLNADLPRLAAIERVHLLTPGANLGFAAGCNAGAAETADEVIAFVNSDCWVEPNALSALANDVLASGGLATASLRLADEPSVLNSAGNPIHFLGFSWAGKLGEPATSAAAVAEVASVSGACFAAHRDLWELLGGFAELYFAYHEDVELSLRCRFAGRSVRYVPGAVAEHAYEFSRNPQKMYLLERNRLLTWVTVWQTRTLLLLLPALVVAELAVVALAVRQGWLRHKLRGWWWLVLHLGWIRDRRRTNRRQRTVQDRDVVGVLSSTFANGPAAPAALQPANRLLDGYWSIVRRWM